MQAAGSAVSLTATIDDYDEICRVVQLYIEGARTGDAARMKEAFHEEARMFGSLMGTRHDIPIAELFRLSEAMPGDTGKYRARILSVSQFGDAAFVALAEDGFWGTVSFVDCFLLTRMGSTWKITCKTFAHMGGEPPFWS